MSRKGKGSAQAHGDILLGRRRGNTARHDACANVRTLMPIEGGQRESAPITSSPDASRITAPCLAGALSTTIPTLLLGGPSFNIFNTASEPMKAPGVRRSLPVCELQPHSVA